MRVLLFGQPGVFLFQRCCFFQIKLENLPVKELRSLVRNPLEYSRKCHDLPVKHDFKLNPTLKTLKNWWASETVTVQTKATAITSSHGRNLLEDLGSESDSDDETASRKKKKAKGKPKKKPT